MPLSTALNTETITSGSTSTITRSGLPFAPKLLHVKWTRINGTGTTTAANAEAGEGWVAASGQWCTVFGSRDNRASNSQAAGVVHTSRALVSLNVAGGILDGQATFALTSDGYTITINTAFGDSFSVDVMAWGGSSINAVVGARSLPTSAGNFATTVTGITPNVLVIGYGSNRNGTQDAYNVTGGGWAGIGMAKSSSNRATYVYGEDTGVATTQGRSRITTDLIGCLHNGATLESTLDFVSFAPDTFTLNRGGSDPSRSAWIGYTAIQVDQSWLGTFSTQTATGNYSVTGVGFQGQSLLLAARADATANETAQYTGNNAHSISRGMALSSSARVAHWHHAEGGIVLGTTETYNARQTTRVLMDYDRTGANTLSLIGDVDFASWGANGFTLTQTDADAQATFVLGLVFGETAGGGGGGNAPRSFGYHQRGMR